MRIYAIRDRMINYYLTPFAAHTDREVQASIATAINNPESLDAIAQAPHHFEIWILGEIDEDGNLKEHKELLATCDSLIRPGLREGGPNQPRARQDGQAPGGGPSQALHPYEHRTPRQRAPEGAPQATAKP